MPPKRKPHAKRRNKAYRRAARRRSYAKHAAERRARQNERNFRHAALEQRVDHAAYEETRNVVTARELRRPSLLWLDPHGCLHREIELSAEELIRRFKRSGQQPDRRYERKHRK
jgi:hypothetical protein